MLGSYVRQSKIKALQKSSYSASDV